MKNIITSIVAGVMLLILTGCADHTAAWMKNQGKINTDNKAVLAAYFGAQASRDSIILTKVTDPTALAMYSMMQGQRDAQVASVFKFEGMERPTNGWDVGKVFFGKTLETAVKFGFGYLIASDLITALGAGTTIGGDYVTMNNNSGGGDLTSSFDYTKAGDDVITDSMNTTN